MRFSGVSAIAIWNNVTRTLTGLGGALIASNGVNQSLAAASSANFAPAAGHVQLLTMAATAAAGGSVVIQFTDATNTWTVVTIAAGTTGGNDTTVTGNTVFWTIHNNAPATAVAYWWTSLQLVT